MTTISSRPATQRLKLKESTGWFAAGSSFRQALAILSDGAFKLFVWLCLHADRRTGRVQITQRQLARTMGKSRRAVGVYVKELVQRGVCRITTGNNQHAASRFEMADEYWPYHRESGKAPEEEAEEKAYVEAIREGYLSLGCGRGRFGPTDFRKARQWWNQGVPLHVVQDALLLGTCRKEVAASNELETAPIGSLYYFEPLLDEVRQAPLDVGYRYYLRFKLKQMADQKQAVPNTDLDREDQSPDQPQGKEWIQ